LTNLMGIQYGNGDPNNETVAGILDLTPRNSQDSFYDINSGTLYRWDNDVDSDPPAPEWVPVDQVYQGFTGDPNDQGGSAIPVYVEGAIAVNDSNTIYTGTVADGWTEFSGGGGGASKVILDCQFCLQSLAHNSTSAPVDFTDITLDGVLEVKDTDSYWSSSDPTKFFLPNPGNLYKVTLHTGVDVANGVSEFTQWQFRFEAIDGSSGSDFEGNVIQALHISDFGRLFPVGSQINNGASLEVTGTVYLRSPSAAGTYIHLVVNQENDVNVKSLAWGYPRTVIEIEDMGA
ncbi:MAG TPA: hypothetical protein VKP88_01935, partial [Candidatus Paceibacterota bacterium]|nr:hypothetical protein [Candidatus Paceibacterota bacterium]